MIDFFEALAAQIGGGFFAAYAAGAEHGDAAVLGGIELAAHILGKV